MWVLRGLRDGVVTTRWPARPDPYAASARGAATVTGAPGPDGAGPDGAGPDGAGPDGAGPDGADPGALCPTRAISDDGGTVRLDQGRCVQCGRCVSQRPGQFAWRRGPAGAALTREALVVPGVAQEPAMLAALRRDLAARTAALRRSVHLRHVDAGSDGTEEWEILALLNPVYDVHRLGIFFTASPRHADVLLVTGAGARSMTEPLRATHQAMPEPKLVMAVGTDAVSGGLLRGGPATTGGVGATLPVDVWVPGSPPSPFSILYGLLLLGRLPEAGGPAGALTEGRP